jgi:carboxyl-terminal processing protease
VLASHSTLLYYLFDDDALIDWGTQYFQKHATIPSAKDLVITDQDFDDFKKMLKESDFKYDRVSEKRLEELKKTAQFEGYYEDAKPEFEALEKKLAHNLDREMEHYQSDIRRLMAQEVIKRYYYMAGKVEESIQGDEDIKAAIGVLHDQSEYKKILGKE